MGKGWPLERYECVGIEGKKNILISSPWLRHQKERRKVGMVKMGGENRSLGSTGLGKTKYMGVERGGDYHIGPTTVQREASKNWVEPH